ncbi:hypothetical protein PG994_009713 [Apiospora phragmitis]|uniref:Heterokaryon incompatibility domain-containing protein n=1 Tax=Apiospora phragmitis TaxID=2905665 RepID=A0ABR1U6W7_9PEZI
MSPFEEDALEGKDWKEELPYRQEELPFSIYWLDYPPRKSTAWYPRPRERPAMWPPRATSVSPHRVWRAEVDWQTSAEVWPDDRSTVWKGKMGHRSEDDRPFYKHKRGPKPPSMQRPGIRRDSIHDIPATKPSSAPSITTVSEDFGNSYMSEQLLDDVTPLEYLCEACRRINPQSLKLGLRHTMTYAFSMIRHLAVLSAGRFICSTKAAEKVDRPEKRNGQAGRGGIGPATASRDLRLRDIELLLGSGSGYGLAHHQGESGLSDHQGPERLGLRYMWIDALRIVQDDKDDWEFEGSRMAGIYAGS